MKDLGDRILGRWLHSHEEDTDEQTVYRRPSFAFPPARGRDGFDFSADGHVSVLGFAREDGGRESDGSWIIEDGTDVKVISRSAGTSTSRQRVIRVLTCEPELLVVANR